MVFEDVTVPEGALRFFDAALSFPGYGAFAQLLHAAIDVGIATSALDAALDAALELTRQVNPDPLTSHLTGELVAQRFAAESVVEKAGRNLDELWASGGTDTSAGASLQVAAAKVTTGALTVDLASCIYELTGTRAPLAGRTWTATGANCAPTPFTSADATSWQPWGVPPSPARIPRPARSSE